MSNSNSSDLILRKEELAKRLKSLGVKSSNPKIRRHSPNDTELNYAYLLIDCSSSMEGSKLLQAKSGSISFAESAFLKNYTIGIITFSSKAYLLTEPISDIRKLKEKVNQLVVDGTTNMAEAFNLAANKFPDSFKFGAVVLVTDGMPDSVNDALEAANNIKSMGIEIIAIGTEDANKEFLERIATRKDLVVPVPQKELAAGITIAAKLLPGSKK